MSEKLKWIALVGNPNSGKSSLFNNLTGLRQKVGNFPGITVDKKTGTYSSNIGETINLIDFPGIYSLYPNSKDGKLVVNILVNPDHDFYPDKIVYVIDPLQLERHLLLATQIIDLGFPTIVAINMMDIAQENNLEINSEYLAEKLGVPVVKLSARTGQGIEELKEHIESNDFSLPKPIYKIGNKNIKLVREVADVIRSKQGADLNNYNALVVAHHYDWIEGITDNARQNAKHLIEFNSFDSLDEQVQETMKRFEIFTPWTKKVVSKTTKETGKLSDKIDKVITHSVFGPIIFFAIMFLIFQGLFSWTSYPMDMIDGAFSWLGNNIKYALGASWFTSLITDGILAGIGGIAIFIPQIFFLFLIISVLEEIGYMSRAVYMFDNVLQVFGLNGRSIVSLISGGACAIPAIMSTRTIKNWKERLNTIMVTPLISCSARIPVYIVLVAFVVPDEKVAGIFNMQGLAFMGLYLISIAATLISAYVFKLVLKSEQKSYLMIELPQYKKPIWKNVILTIREKLWSFIWEAGKVIFVISIILWFLASFGPQEKMATAQQEAMTYSIEQNLSSEETQNIIAAKKIEASYAGHMGKFIEPVIKPLGFDWKMGIALITSFAAREVFVSTMATIYSIGSVDDESSIRERLAKEVNIETGLKVYTPAVAMSLLIFYLFAMQCMSTLAITKRETNSWKWPIIQFVYMTALAYIGSFIVYQLMS